MVKIIECPRDAMQGLHDFIPTALKAKYINQLLKVGFDTIDFGSFVSPKAIPQMRDTSLLLDFLDISEGGTKLLAIVANQRGAEEACQFEKISYLGYPFSISETFQKRNTNASILESLERAEYIQNLCIAKNKKLVAYLSMGFGNPYGDEWNFEVVKNWIDKLMALDIKIISLSDTIGIADAEKISEVFNKIIPNYPEIEFGAHFHTTPDTWYEKVDAAFKNGCKRFDGAIKGYGGCPMAKDDLTGNMPTENIISYLENEGILFKLDRQALGESIEMAVNEVFPPKISIQF
jgi:hydroxymethylglutaryl-CoA lyase